jgi:ABC-type polysaccharide/polyol phosphate export permease
VSPDLPPVTRRAPRPSVRELWQYRSLIANLTGREIKVKYKRSLLGWIWSLINPASQLLTYTLVFGYFFKAEPPVAGNGELKSYAIYLFTGLVTWNFFAGIVNSCMNGMVAGGALMKKVYFPPVVVPIAMTLSVLAQTAIEFAILVVVLGIAGNLGISFLLLPFLLLALLVFSMGVGLALSVYNVYYRDVAYLVGVVLNLLFYATPIIYTMEIVPDDAVRFIRANPLTQFVDAARDLLYLLDAPSGLQALGITVLSATTFVVGWLVFHRKAAELTEEL